MGSIYDQHLHNTRLALKSYRIAVTINPGSVDAHYAMAQLYLRQKQPRRALAKFQEILKLAPDDVAVQLKLALIYFELKDFPKAIEEFERILKQNPDADKIDRLPGSTREEVP